VRCARKSTNSAFTTFSDDSGGAFKDGLHFRGFAHNLPLMALEYRLMRPEEASEVCKLVEVVFDHYEAPEYSPEGIAEFRRYNRPEEMIKRSNSGHFALVAADAQSVIGIIEIRNNRHISMFFIAQGFQGKGIGRQLWHYALKKSQDADNSVREFTVNSSPYGVPIYEKLGFCKTSPEQVRNGLRFIPMTMRL